MSSSMAAKTAVSVTIGGHELKVSNPDKVLFPNDGYSKGDLVDYYRAVAPLLIPHLRDRPLTLQRYPDGINGPSFFEKQAPKFTPPWIKTIKADAAFSSNSSKKIDYLVCNDEATLVFCANLASIVLHTWYSREKTLDNPDFLLFDLDPFECTLKTLATVALALHDALKEIGLEALVKTSGGSGMHVIVPLRPVYSYDTVKGFGELVARRVASCAPDLVTLERTIARRPRGVVYLDYVQVGRGKTVVPPFVVRARDGAPVSTPLAWDEVRALARKRTADPSAEFAKFTMKNAPARLKREGDLWGGAHWRQATLEPALKKARKLWES